MSAVRDKETCPHWHAEVVKPGTRSWLLTDGGRRSETPYKCPECGMQWVLEKETER